MVKDSAVYIKIDEFDEHFKSLPSIDFFFSRTVDSTFKIKAQNVLSTYSVLSIVEVNSYYVCPIKSQEAEADTGGFQDLF